MKEHSPRETVFAVKDIGYMVIFTKKDSGPCRVGFAGIDPISRPRRFSTDPEIPSRLFCV
jgi:hypothetical protein